MRQKVHTFLSAFTLLEWGAIMLYFYFSKRLGAFLHPNFHTLVLVVGLLLVLTAVCLLFTPDEAEDEHHREQNEHAHEGCCEHHSHECGHEHSFSVKAATSFFILLVPFGFAAWISPNGFGATKIRNSDVVEDVNSLPGIADREKQLQKSANETSAQKAPVYAGVDRPDDAGGTTQYAAPEIKFDGPSRSLPDFPMPTKNSANAAGSTPAGPAAQADTQQDQSEALKPDKDGNIQATVIDLLYAAEDPSIRQDITGKSLKLLGQYMPDKTGKPGNSRFKLMRVFMVCCAADARPISVLVDTKAVKGFKSPKEMQWLNVVGNVTFQQEGERLTPVFNAKSVTPSKEPDDVFLY